MPKIIKNLEDRLLEEAARQIRASGYGAMTVRSVAKACGIGVGTVYNYFPSKEALVAAYMLEDWKQRIAAIRAVSSDSENPQPVMLCIYDHLNAFADRHAAVLKDEAAAAGFAGAFSQYHSLLRDQLAQPVRKFCSGDFAAQFVVESLLTWTMAGRSFPEIYGIVEKLF